MDSSEYNRSRQFLDTSFGRIAYVERGRGETAVLLHAFGMNGFQWRDVLPALAGHARCLAIDLLGMGYTEMREGVTPNLREQAEMVAEVIDRLNVGPVHLVGNDSGGGVAQFVAIDRPALVRSLCLIDCEVHDNFPPPGLKSVMDMAARNELGDTFRAFLADLSLARSAFGSAFYVRPDETLTEEVARAYLQPLTRNEKSVEDFTRFVLAIDNAELVAAEPRLKNLGCPALVLWGEQDQIFAPEWGEWLRDTLPNAELKTIPEGGLGWPEEQPQVLCRHLQAFWTSSARA